MKLKLDRTQQHLPKLFWLALVVLCSWIIIRQLPVNWVGGALASQTGCRVILHQPIGTIWQGSAALAFSEPNSSEGGCRDPLSVTERFHWTTSCKLLSMACNTEIEFGALDKPQLIAWGWGRSQIASNEIKLPANVLEGLGNPWSTLRPRGDLGARWTDINLGAGDQNAGSLGVIRIIISNLTSPISPVRPLGSYEMQVNMTQDGANWNLSTTSGPLLLKGQGEIGNQSGNSAQKAGVHFSGEASASPEAQDSLIGLLSLLGKKEGDIYRLKF